MSNSAVMVGITTEQNTANAIPIIQLGVSGYVPINTERALKEEWNRGLKEVLLDRDVKVYEGVSLTNEESRSVVKIVEKVEREIKSRNLWKNNIYWNIGGGQKIHQIALWFLYQKRQKEGLAGDKMVYAEPFSGTLNVMDFKDEVKQEVMRLKSNLSIKELLKIYGNFVVVEGKSDVNVDSSIAWKIVEGRRVNSKDGICSMSYVCRIFDNEVSRLWRDRERVGKMEFDLYWEKLKKRIKGKIRARCNLSSGIVNTLLGGKSLKRAVREIYNKNRMLAFSSEGISAVLCKYFGTHLKKNGHIDGIIFEAGVQSIIFDYIKELDPDREVFIDVGFNVKIESPKNPGDIVAEYDTLIATNTGTLLSFDAKVSFKSSNVAKDWLARRLRIERAGGIYAKWIAVIPESFFYKRRENLADFYTNIMSECDMVVVSRNKNSFSLPFSSFKLPSLLEYLNKMVSIDIP